MILPLKLPSTKLRCDLSLEKPVVVGASETTVPLITL